MSETEEERIPFNNIYQITLKSCTIPYLSFEDKVTEERGVDVILMVEERTTHISENGCRTSLKD